MNQDGIKPSKPVLSVLCLALVALSAVSWASASGINNLATSDESQAAPWYDTGHEYVTTGLQRAASWLDSFFGDPRAEVQTDASAYLNVVLDAFYSGVEDQSENGVRFRGGADLPRLDRRLRLLVTSDAEATTSGRELAGTAQDDVRDTEGAIGLRYRFLEHPRHQFSLSGGLAGGLSPELILAARSIYTQPWTLRTASHLTSTLYWRSDDGSGVSALLDYEWTSDEDTLWRYTLFGDYRERLRGLDWSAQAKWARRLNDTSAINLRGGVQGATEPRNQLTEGWLKFLYRRRFLRPWLFYEVEPGLSWHQLADYRLEPTLALRLEIQFRRKE
jgi:hypothetical protein